MSRGSPADAEETRGDVRRRGETQGDVRRRGETRRNAGDAAKRGRRGETRGDAAKRGETRRNAGRRGRCGRCGETREMRGDAEVLTGPADAEGKAAHGGPGACPRRGVWGLGPQKTPPFGLRRRRVSAEQRSPNQKGRLAVRSLGVASPRGADAGPRGEVSGESSGQKGLIVCSVYG